MIEFVEQIRGYSTYLSRPRYSEHVWQVCKDMFWPDKFILEQLKMYSRSTLSLANLYEMISYYNRDPHPMPKDDRLLDSVFYQAAQDFRIRKDGSLIPMRHINDLEPSHFTLSTNPGYPYTYWGFAKKRDCFEIAKKRARYLCHRIKEQMPVHLPPSMIFARTSVTEKGSTKLRGVWGKPFDLLIAESSLYLPFIEEYVKAETPNGYRYTLFHRGYYRLYEEATSIAPNYKSRYVMLDFKKYDTSLPPWLLRRARNIIDSQIDFGKYENWGNPIFERSYRLARRLFKATIDTEFIMPDGYIWRKRTGTDSGSLVFQRDEDICTYVLGRYLAAKLGRQCLYIRVLGDDIFMALEGSDDIDMKLSRDILFTTFGVELNMEKSYTTTDIVNAQFLGRYISHGIPRRDTIDIVLSALYPRETDGTLFDCAQRIVALMYENCYNNDTAQRFLRNCWETLPKYVRDYCEYGEIQWSTTWNKVMKLYGLKQLPKCMPPTLDFIIYLLVTPPNWSVDYQGNNV